MASPQSLADEGVAARASRKRSRRALDLSDTAFFDLLEDPESAGDSGSDSESEDEGLDRDQRDALGELMNEVEWQDDVVEDGGEVPRGAEEPVNRDFIWEEDFNTFRGQMESYSRVPGPTYYSQDPTDIFCRIWTPAILDRMADETNRYAWQLISKLSELKLETGRGLPDYLTSWWETNADELYRYMALTILFSFCLRSRVQDYWTTGVLGMPAFREIMSRNRYLLLTKFLHFVDNDNLVSSGYDRQIAKVMPLVEHCNSVFGELYTPSQHLSLDESLLLWKGRLSWRQCIRSKAARFGIKSFELCESTTGYLLQYKLYAGKESSMHPGPLHGFSDTTAKVVLALMERYLDKGHVLVMDNWYNQLPLARYLKSRHTDVLGTISRRRNHIPACIKDLMPKQLRRGESVSRHCGDVALVAWQDVKLVTVMSTYHQHEMVPGTRAGQRTFKPVAVREYNKYMGGVDLKDKKCSNYLLERKRHRRWYIKVLRKLINISCLNTFIIYTRTPMYELYSHRQCRLKVVEGLLSRYPRESSVPSRAPSTSQTATRLLPGKHYPVPTDFNEGRSKRKQLRCVRCAALKKRTLVTIKCKSCQVPLCVGTCWEDYHELEKL